MVWAFLHTKQKPGVPAPGFLLCWLWTKDICPAICKYSSQLQMLRQIRKRLLWYRSLLHLLSAARSESQHMYYNTNKRSFKVSMCELKTKTPNIFSAKSIGCFLFYPAVMPPSTVMMLPVIKLLAGEATLQIACAISSARPMRPSGYAAAMSAKV